MVGGRIRFPVAVALLTLAGAASAATASTIVGADSSHFVAPMSTYGEEPLTMCSTSSEVSVETFDLETSDIFSTPSAAIRAYESGIRSAASESTRLLQSSARSAREREMAAEIVRLRAPLLAFETTDLAPANGDGYWFGDLSVAGADEVGARIVVGSSPNGFGVVEAFKCAEVMLLDPEAHQRLMTEVHERSDDVAQEPAPVIEPAANEPEQP